MVSQNAELRCTLILERSFLWGRSGFFFIVETRCRMDDLFCCHFFILSMATFIKRCEHCGCGGSLTGYVWFAQ